MPVGQCLLSAGRLGATQEDQASSGRSVAALRALFTDPPQEILDVCATEDLGEIPDPEEAEAYANVGASTSLPDLAVGAAANVGATTSLAIGLRQTTTHTNLRTEIDIGKVR